LISVQFLGIVYDINIKKANKSLADAEMLEMEELALLAESVEESGEQSREEEMAERTGEMQSENAADNAFHE
jgi:hypothetical protein